jgi:hypothetical protein
MKKPHRDLLIIIGATIVIVTACIVAIFGLPTGGEKDRLMNFDGVDVDTILEGDIPILDNDVVIPLSATDTIDVDSAETDYAEEGTINTNDTIKH